jgi:D-alanyl-D-alanine carboxypeptidase
MFELLVNLMLTSLFLQSQTDSQATVDVFTREASRLPRAEVVEMQKEAPQKDITTGSVGVEVSAQSVLVADAKTGKVLYSKDPKQVRSIASLTKLMTALVFVENNPGWQEEVTISSADYREGGIVYLVAGEVVSVRDLFYASLVASSNEATVALVRSTGLSEEEFIGLMNKKAKQLGMLETTFSDMTGLSVYNRSTAADVVVMSRAAFNNSDITKAVSASQYSLQIINKSISRSIKSTNKILHQEFGVGDDTYVVGAGKTGYLDAAGYCLSSRIVDDKGRKVYAVVLGSSTTFGRFVDTKSLAYWVFNNYKW